MFAIHCDSTYLQFAKVFVESACKNDPEEFVFVSSVNLSLSEISSISQGKVNVLVQNHLMGGCPEGSRRYILQNRVSKVALEVFKEELDDVAFIMDADMIVRGSFSVIKSKMKEYDVGLCLNCKTHLKRTPPQLINGVIGLNLSRVKTLHFFERYDECLHASGILLNYDGKLVRFSDQWRRDQACLYDVYMENKETLEVMPLDKPKFFGESPEAMSWSMGMLDKEETMKKFKEAIV